VEALDNPQTIAAAWMALALAASVISIRLGISVSLTEILVGVVAGNFFHLQNNEWTNFLAGFGSVLLTFLAGAEIDPGVLRRRVRETASIGVVAFFLPFLAALAFAYFVSGWDLRAAEIAGIALSTTSVAVVYAVMVETGMNETELGKIILTACFINDLGTVLALGALFANFNQWLILFAAVAIPVIIVMPRVSSWVFATLGGRVSEPEVKFLFVVLFFLGGLAVSANSEAVLPAYLVGMAVATVFARERVLVQRTRTIAFALLTPFFFIRAGALISLPAVASSLGIITMLFAVKVGAKLVGVQPLTSLFRFGHPHGMYTTLLMSTGLTFGTISALFGLNHGIIDQTQYTVLVTVVILTALVPTLIAQQFFQPEVTPLEQTLPEMAAEGALAAPERA